MSTEETKAIAVRYFERLDQRDLDGLVEMYAPNLQFRFGASAARPGRSQTGYGGDVHRFPRLQNAV